MRDIVSAATAAGTTSPASPLAVNHRDLLVSHQRSASDDVAEQQHERLMTCDDVCHSGWSVRVSGDVSRTSSRRTHQRPRAAAVSRRDTMPPIHLMSATNQVRSGLVQPQQLPLKLASISDSITRRPRPRWASGSPTDRAPCGRSDAASYRPAVSQHQSGVMAQTEAAAGGGGEFVTEESGVNEEADVRVTGKQSPAGVHDDNTSTSTRTSHHRTPDTGSLMKSQSPTASVASMLLPMKLAERRRPKSASSSPSAHTASTTGLTTDSSSTPQAGDTSTSRLTTSVGSVRSRALIGPARCDSCSPPNVTHCTVQPTQRHKATTAAASVIYF